MKRALRFLAFGLLFLAAGLAALVFAAIWTAQWALSKEKLTPLIERAATDFLQRPLTIGDIERPRFPITAVTARNVRLLDKSGAVLVDCPEVTAKGSLVSVLKLRLGVDEMTFHQPQINIRFLRDGRTNVERIVDDIAAQPASPVRHSIGTLVFHKFVIDRASVTVTDARGRSLLPRPAVGDGDVTLHFAPRGVRAPFHLRIDDGEGGFRAETSGRFSRFASVTLAAERLPAALLAPRFPALAACDGNTDGRFRWTKRGERREDMDFAFSPARFCGKAGPLPRELSGTANRDGAGWHWRLDAAGEKTDARLLADVPAARRTALRLQLAAPRADVSEVMDWESTAHDLFVSTPEATRLPVQPMEMSVRVSTLTFERIAAYDGAAEIHRSTGNVVRLDPVTATVFKGRLHGAAEIDGSSVTVDAAGEGLDLETAARTFGSTSPLTGLLAFRLNGRAPTGAALAGFDGHLTANLTDGRVPKIPAVLKALTGANLIKLEEQLKGGKNQEGIEVRQGVVEASLHGGIASVEKGMLDSRVLRLGYTGKVNYVAGKLDGVLVLQPLNLADQIINDIPVLRTLLHGNDKTFLPLWFSVKGAWADPKVRSMPTKSLTTPVKNVLNGILGLPQRAYDAIRGKKD